MEQKVYDFCPKCGAVTLNGVCPSCGRKGSVQHTSHSEDNVTSHVHTAEDDIWQESRKPAEKRNTDLKRVKVGILTFSILFFTFLAVGILFPLFQVIHSREVVFRDLEENGLDFDDEDGYTTDYEEDGYVTDYDEDEREEEENVSSSIWDTTHTNHFGETFDSEYYEQVVDYIDENVGYEIERQEYTYQDPEKAIDIKVSYVQIVNDEQGRNMSNFNEILRQDAMYYEEVMEEEESQRSLYEDCTIRTDAYVTYNDESIISVVFNEETTYDGVSIYNRIWAYVMDVNLGSITYCSDLLNYDSQFVEDWMEMSEKQNGKIAAEGVEFTKKELLEFFNSNDCIAYYTPLGLEVGYNYYDEDTTISGWITVTMKDYEKYFKKM